MEAIANFDLIEAMNRHSTRMSVWQDSGMILNFNDLASELLGEPPTPWPVWDYYSDKKAHDLFDKITDTGLVTYYAEPRERFAPIQGIRAMNKANKSFVILEDMS